MKRTLSAAIALLLFASLPCLVACGRPQAKVKANDRVVTLVKTWDKNVSFYTSKKNPLKTIEGLRQNEIACWDWTLSDKIKAFYDAADTSRTYGNAVQVIAPHNVSFAANFPRLYLTWTSNEPKLKDAERVVFTE